MLASAKIQRALMLILLALLGAIVFIVVKTPSPPAPADSRQVAGHSGFDGPTMPPNLMAHNFTLTDQYGHTVSLAADRGKVVVLTFIHSLCHDTCPFMVEQIKGALNDLPDNGRDVPTIGVSVAPGEDTVHNRQAFLAKHEMAGRIEFVNGPLREMRRVWHDYAIQPVTPKVDHSTFVLLLDKRGYERVGFAADQLTPEGLAHDIRVLERQS
ncbi:MAG TPA: SCO family protein [Solirubrobacteraceae bacterium]|jgi:protein SCO1/2|nr:SCO family protein [Solirubrobacteraceae bacterium]